MIQKSENINYLSWAIALSAMLISLIFSEILNYPPCALCWYQRIFMYPLVFIIPTAIVIKDPKIHNYVVVLSFLGLIISGYHSLIYHEFISESLKVCTASLSCKSKQFELFGLISIPVMSFFSFLLIFILNLKGANHDKRN